MLSNKTQGHLVILGSRSKSEVFPFAIKWEGKVGNIMTGRPLTHPSLAFGDPWNKHQNYVVA